MSTSQPTAFIIGYGTNIGTSVAQKFKANGFNVAVAARSIDNAKLEKEGLLGIKLDVSKIKDISGAFDEVEKAYGPAATVVYNIGIGKWAPGGASDPLSLPWDDFYLDATISGLNAFEVARRANAGFDKLEQGASKVFIVTGNVLPWISMPQAVGLSVGKRAMANIIEACAEAYGPTGKRWYFAHQVSLTNGPAIPPDGPTHAEIYYDLYQRKEQGPWEVRFVKGGKLWKDVMAERD